MKLASIFYNASQIFLLVLIFILGIRVIETIFESRGNNKFVLKSFLSNTDLKEQEVESTFLERLVSIDKYKAHLQRALNDAHMNLSATKFIIQRVIFAASICLFVVVLYFIVKQPFFLYLAVPLSIVGYMIPKNRIGKSKKRYINQMKTELPNYLYHFSVLLEDYTPYEATKKSSEYAGGLLKPFVERLISQIALYPSSHQPYYEFADSVGIREAKEFVSALEQIMKVDSKASARIIKDQIEIMNQLQEESYNEQIELRPEQTEPYINVMLYPFFAVFLTAIVVTIMSSLSDI